MARLDLVHRDHTSANYMFKHALVRDALYESLLRNVRTRLHLTIAQEIERRGANRLGEAAELLAHHYAQTDRVHKAFIYLAMAGGKSLGVYSLDEAEAHLATAVRLLEENAARIGDAEVANLLVDYTLLLNLKLKLRDHYRNRKTTPCEA